MNDAVDDYAASGERTKMRTASGAMIDVAAPDWRLISLEDIAHALAASCRWNGNLRRQVSILEHSLNVASQVPQRARLEANLHDAHEYILGDWARPVVSAISLRLPEFFVTLGVMKRRADIAIAAAVLEEVRPGGEYNLSDAERLATFMHSPTVAAADNLMGAAEFSAYHKDGDGVLGARLGLAQDIPPADLLIRVWLKLVRKDAAQRYCR